RVLEAGAAGQGRKDASAGRFAVVEGARIAIVAGERRPGLTARLAAARLVSVAGVSIVAERVPPLVDLPVAVVVDAVADLDADRGLDLEDGVCARGDGIGRDRGRRGHDARVAASGEDVGVDPYGERRADGKGVDADVERIVRDQGPDRTRIGRYRGRY